MACCAASRDNLIRVQDLPNTHMENAKFVKDHKEMDQVKNRPFWIKKDIFEQPRFNNFFSLKSEVWLVLITNIFINNNQPRKKLVFNCNTVTSHVHMTLPM